MKKWLVWLIVITALVLIAFLAWQFLSRDITSTDEKSGKLTGAVTTSDELSEGNDPALNAPAIAFDDVAKSIKSEYKQDLEFQLCADQVVQQCLTQTINAKILTTENLVLCDDFLTPEARESCTISHSYQLARSKKDTVYCEKLTDEPKSNCLLEVAIAKAIDGENLSECDIVGENKDQCVNTAAQRIASNTGDGVWCDRISESEREMCQQEITFREQEEARQREFEAELAQLEREQEQQAQERASSETAPDQPVDVREDPAPEAVSTPDPEPAAPENVPDPAVSDDPATTEL